MTSVSLLPLQQTILYGPVNSRRLGRSLGINLMPAKYKLCSYNCVYCHYGWTKIHTLDTSTFEIDMPRPDDVVDAVKAALTSCDEFEYLTFSGNGEPTLYPKFSSMVAEIGRLRDKYRPGLKIALLSNSSGLVLPDVQKSIVHIDMPIFKLDVGTDQLFRCINRPAPGVYYEEIVENLQCLRGIIIQTVLLQGNPSNTEERDLQAYFDRIRTIHPRAVHIYSIDRPVPNTNIRRVQPDGLNRIAQSGTQKTGVEFIPYYLH